MSSKTSSKVSVQTSDVEEIDYSQQPEFIYGGPFVEPKAFSPFMDIATPINIPLSGTFKKSFAYYSLKERLPTILTKIIDYISRESTKIKSSTGCSAEDCTSLIQYISKLKNDLMTNKKYDLLTVETPEAKKWNEWILNVENSYYFTNTWLFTECYVYRRLREGCELRKGLQNFDVFAAQKAEAFQSAIEPMCLVSEKVLAMMPESPKDKRKADFITLLKLSLWSNKCDLSLSNGDNVTTAFDPLQAINDWKDKLIADDSAKIADQVFAKAETVKKNIENAPPAVKKDTPPPEPEGEEPPKVPCPAKMTVPQYVMFDIVCDNAGYELFADLCLGSFLISQGVVEKVRYHLKNIPWFVSDVTPADFKYVINACATASFRKEIPSTSTGEDENAPPEPPQVLTAESLNSLAAMWDQYFKEGKFIVMSDNFWTSPHPYKDMKKYEPNLYRKLQFAIAVCYKGDLNYRKLLADKNWPPYAGFESCLQGFIPASAIALRTVKADVICALPKGKLDQLRKVGLAENWMTTGDYGVIQFCAKAEPLKVADRPCLDYGETCYGVQCPVHTDL